MGNVTDITYQGNKPDWSVDTVGYHGCGGDDEWELFILATVVYLMQRI